MESSSRPPEAPFLARFIATGFYSGYIPWASGTFGSIVGLLIYAIPGVEQPLWLSLLIVLGFAAGVVSAAHVARAEGHRLTKTAAATKAIFQPEAHATPDPSIVVIDEIVGMWISLLLLPKGFVPALIAFFAFRAFDILKPPPARQLERIPDGWGIMLDDVIAGLYANIVTQLLYRAALGIILCLLKSSRSAMSCSSVRSSIPTRRISRKS